MEIILYGLYWIGGFTVGLIFGRYFWVYMDTREKASNQSLTTKEETK